MSSTVCWLGGVFFFFFELCEQISSTFENFNSRTRLLNKHPDRRIGRSLGSRCLVSFSKTTLIASHHFRKKLPFPHRRILEPVAGPRRNADSSSIIWNWAWCSRGFLYQTSLWGVEVLRSQRDSHLIFAPLGDPQRELSLVTSLGSHPCRVETDISSSIHVHHT